MAMEVYNGTVMRSRPLFNSGGAGIDQRHRDRVCVGGLSRIPFESRLRSRSTRRRVVGAAFEDKEHAEYYNRCAAPDFGEERKEVRWNCVSEKKRAKLLKDLAKNLSMFSELGFGLETDNPMAKGIPEAAMVLQSHLENLRAQREKLKVRRKQSNVKEGSESSSSSSSSESSDSEPDNDQLAVRQQLVEQESMSSEPRETMTADSSPEAAIEQVGEVGVMVHNAEDTSGQLKRVEVCMGGKCKKMGAQVLVDEFQRVLGGSVVECCKCMGKCKTAPNVRIFNAAAADADADSNADANSVGSPNLLYLGVGLEDVGLIAAYYLGSDQACLGVSLSSMSTLPSLGLKQ